ncbi:Hint domain-containing protein [Acetobacter sp.]|uniref:Hint domain-containing protein n=1 Tax=Acetobacter sp. TaxID=440 RepID=UPI002587A99D|nr:Hint domain-containing protein [Acetobacter sp.]MCC6105474.1 Hint domain-containing protein [Acetobacter sp.]
MTKYTTASGVVYNITQPYGSAVSDWDVTITAPDGTSIYTGTDLNPGIDLVLLQLAASGYVLTGTDDYTTLISAASAQTIVTAPGSTGSIIIGVGAAEANTYYIGGDNTISGLVSAIAGTTINVVGGTATLSGNTGGSLVGLLTGSTVNIEYGGTFNTGAALASVLEGGTVNFGAGGGTLILNGGGTAISLLASGTLSATTINNYDPSQDTIELQDTTGAVASYTITDGSSSSKVITLLNDSGETVAEYAVNLADGVTLPSGDYSTSSTDAASNPLQITYSDDNTYITACFLTGTLIRTPDGNIAVEDIKIGDQIVTWDWKNNQDITRPVVWVGKAETIARPDLPVDEAGYPVRVLKNAVADGVPSRDMLITPEHCLFFENKFIPVRMLVNGASIFYDTSVPSYTYYHVETEQHAVIIADGMLTESYLDTGNRRAFRQAGNVAGLRSNGMQNWAEHADAPLCVDRAFVEPLFRALKARHDHANTNRPYMEHAVLTDDPDLHLVTETGVQIRPVRHTGQTYSFMLPPATRSVRIVSRASRPADVIGPFVDDRRHLGVAVGAISCLTAKKMHALTAHFQENKPAGWHREAEAGTPECVWTNGNAVLPLGDLLANDAMALLSLTIHAAGPYRVEPAVQTATLEQSA